MSAETPIIALPSARAVETRVIGGVSAAHLLSHVYFLLLPPVFLFVRAEYGVSYTELAVALSVFNIVSAVFQTPAGIIADRVGPYAMLVGGLLLEAVAFALVGLVHSFWFLVAMFGVAGLGNTVFHPCDYALLSHHVPKERVGRAFSIHTFAGLLGSAIAPTAVLALNNMLGWRGAFIVPGLAGIAVTALLLLQRADFADGPHLARKAKADASGAANTDWQLLLSGPILRSLGFFTALAAITVGIQNYSVVALEALFGTPLALGNSALTGYLLLSAIGVLVGGVIVHRVRNHGMFAALGLLVSALTIAAVGIADIGTFALLTFMSVAGLASGVIMPSRDMIVREVTPAGAFGTVFGFVTTGFNIAGVVFPLVFAALMDHGMPRAVFMLSAACCLVSIATVISVRRRPAVAVAH